MTPSESDQPSDPAEVLQRHLTEAYLHLDEGRQALEGLTLSESMSGPQRLAYAQAHAAQVRAISSYIRAQLMVSMAMESAPREIDAFAARA